MKVAIVGSKSISNENLVNNYISECLINLSNIDLIISGGAKGVDTIAELYAKNHNIKTKIFHPNWEKYGKQADLIRNSDIISKCEICIIIWDGESLCTKNDIDLCDEMRKPCYVFDISKNKKYKLNI